MCKRLFLRNFFAFRRIFLSGNAALEANKEIDSFEEDEVQILKNWLQC